jgi:hypothetical protein
MAIDQIYRHGAAPNTRVAISQKNRVFSQRYGNNASKTQIGVLNTFSYDESRTIDPVRGIGFGDKIAELVPGITEPMSIKLNRTMLYTQGIVQELGYKGGVDGLVRSLRHHRWPFDLRQELVFSEIMSHIPTYPSNGQGGRIGQTAFTSLSGETGDPTTAQAIVTQFIACWLESYSVDFSSDNALVMEDATAKATDVCDAGIPNERYNNTLDAGNNPASNQGSLVFTG